MFCTCCVVTGNTCLHIDQVEIIYLVYEHVADWAKTPVSTRKNQNRYLKILLFADNLEEFSGLLFLVRVMYELRIRVKDWVLFEYAPTTF